ncbi:ISL3 family transposase [Streptomyces sp. BA2]|nr:ISL3 family transposase [Streptomyces sp. BA2]
MVHVEARTRGLDVVCPDCTTASGRVHSTYERHLADGPVGGQAVRIDLTVRRLYCENAGCARRTFAEQVRGLTVRYGRRTPAAQRVLEAVAIALAGRAGSRLAIVLNTRVSRMTLLRAVMNVPDPAWNVPRVLGVDDFATRRGQHYGTVLIDCETHRPLDLLPGRDAATLATWLREQPGSAVICRGRAGAYAEGARAGAPDAVQVADRFHLWQNLGTALERSVRRHSHCLKAAGTSADGLVNDTGAAEVEQFMSPIEARIRERHATIHRLLAQGHGIREIARELHMGGNTVRRTARAAAPEELLSGRHQPRRSQLDPYKAHLDQRWAQGFTNAVHLHAELRAFGYQGGYQPISDYLQPRRRRRIRVVAPAPPGVRQVTGWMMRHPEHLGIEERRQLTALLARCPGLTALNRHVRAFAETLTTRSGQHLKDWIIATNVEDLPGLSTFAHGLEKDWEAVVQGLTTRWNSGPVEGRVNHIKMIKCQMFGRAGLSLLRKRVLLTAAR